MRNFTGVKLPLLERADFPFAVILPKEALSGQMAVTFDIDTVFL